MPAHNLTIEECKKLGQKVRTEYNHLTGAFAAELIGESYPFSEKMAEVLFMNYSNEDLGRRFALWIDKAEQKNARS